MASKICLYTISGSEHCRLTKALLLDLKVDFEEVNLDKDDDAKEELVKVTGQWSVPALITINADTSDVENIVIGFEPNAIKDAVK
ncbi:MAG: glutaredoxin domain-containing protein [Patescibacteria group bacterium]|jgi:glutaredoxin